MIQYSEFKEFFENIPAHSELEVFFEDVDEEYMLIKYEDAVTFARCGIKVGSGEFEYGSLDDLYHAETVDGICLERDWSCIECVLAHTSAGCFHVGDSISRE